MPPNRAAGEIVRALHRERPSLEHFELFVQSSIIPEASLRRWIRIYVRNVTCLISFR
jgi:hypothetical protein